MKCQRVTNSRFIHKNKKHRTHQLATPPSDEPPPDVCRSPPWRAAESGGRAAPGVGERANRVVAGAGQRAERDVRSLVVLAANDAGYGGVEGDDVHGGVEGDDIYGGEEHLGAQVAAGGFTSDGEGTLVQLGRDTHTSEHKLPPHI